MHIIVRIAYSDSCYKEKFLLEEIGEISSLSTYVYGEITNIQMFEHHWEEKHKNEGGFPFADESLYPSSMQIKSLLESLEIQQRKFIVKLRINNCLYSCTIQRVD